MKDDYARYREMQLEDGRVFQDFAADALYSIGIPIVVYSSALYQHKVGESRGGWEIKHDKQFKRTGNLYIETAEKAQPRPGAYWRSGIYAEPLSTFYVIGDFDRLFVFPTRWLRMFHRAGRYAFIDNNGTRTSQGYLLPVSDAAKYAILEVTPNCSEQITLSMKELRLRAVEMFRKLRVEASEFTLPLPFDEREGTE